MNAQEVAQIVADALTMQGYPYMGVEIQVNPGYPTIRLWDDGKESMVIIACSDETDDRRVKTLAVDLALSLVATGEAPTGAIGYPAWPDAGDPDAVSIPEWGVFKKSGSIELPGQPKMDWKTEYAMRDPDSPIVIRVWENGLGWLWSAIAQTEEDSTVAKLPGAATPEEAMLAAEDWYRENWLPNLQTKDKGET